MTHQGFMMAKNMDWLKIDTVAVLNHHYDICDPKTYNSTCKKCNDKCKNQEFKEKI